MSYSKKLIENILTKASGSNTEGPISLCHQSHGFVANWDSFIIKQNEGLTYITFYWKDLELGSLIYENPVNFSRGDELKVTDLRGEIDIIIE